MATAPPKIAALEPGTHRPSWSVMIPTYNSTRYLKETLASVLEQDPGAGEMQIEIVDNCSSIDDPAKVLRELAITDRVTLHRQPRAVSMSENWNTCVERSAGKWVHILHSDDRVLPGFYQHFQSVMDRPNVGMAFCRFVWMDENSNWHVISPLEACQEGVLARWTEDIMISNRVQTPSIVVQRRVYEEVGGYDPRLCYAPDWDMWKRIAATHAVWFQPQILACYRVHTQSVTAQVSVSGRRIADVRRSIKLAERYLPYEAASRLARKSRRHYALEALENASNLYRARNYVAALTTIQEALALSCSIQVLKRLPRIAINISLRMGREIFRKWRGAASAAL